MTLLIREAGTDDLDSVLDLLEAAGIGAPESSDRTAATRLFERIRSVGGCVLLAEDDVGPVGTLTWFALPLLAHGGRPAALVEDVAVDPARQRSGVGRALMRAALELAQAAGCYKLALSSNVRRAQAHMFYERLGFAQHGLSFAIALEPAAGRV